MEKTSFFEETFYRNVQDNPLTRRQTMKIAISAQGTDMASEVDPRFGRARYFVIFDTDRDRITQVIDNQAAQDAAHGAGIGAATKVAEAGAETVITGRVGPKAFAVLHAAGIKIVSNIAGRVKDAVENFINGKAHPADGPGCDAHSGQGMGMGGRRGGGAFRGGGAGGGRGGCGCRRN